MDTSVPTEQAQDDVGTSRSPSMKSSRRRSRGRCLLEIPQVQVDDIEGPRPNSVRSGRQQSHASRRDASRAERKREHLIHALTIRTRDARASAAVGTAWSR